MDDTTLVTFEVVAACEPGETVCVSGDHGELGAFVRQAARELVTDPITYPVWRLSVLLPRGAPRQYKYLKTGFGQIPMWEPISTRYRTIVPEGDSMVVRDEFGSYVDPASKATAASTPAVTTPSPTSAAAAAAVTSTTTGHGAPDKASLLHFSTKRTLTRKTTSSGQKRLLLVAFHLPVKLHFVMATDTEETWTAEWDPDNVAAKTEDSVADEIHVTWIGAITPSIVFGTDFSFTFSEKRIAGLKRVLEPMHCFPVFLDESVYNLHYTQFSKNLLWDIFHNVLRPKNIAPETSYENGYVPGNTAFADVVMPFLQPGDIVWVHDYHLMLLPKMLRARGHEGPMILFLHVPFPTSEIFRTLPMRHEILEGMLSSSAIGFHTFNHGRHFLTACRRFLGAQSQSDAHGSLAVEYRDRRVLITISHLGVDPIRITTAATSAAAQEQAQRLIASLPSSQEGTNHNLRSPTVVFGSLDELHRLKGVTLKLLAFERMLSTSHKWQDGSARFILWTIRKSGKARLHDVNRSVGEVRRLVKRINDAFGPVVCLREFDSRLPPTLHERMSLWLATDVFVSTAVSEGLNLMPLEYLLSRAQESPGVVIISEFSASSSVLNGAVRVNCYDIGFIAKAMDDTTRMPIEEKQMRRARDVDYVSSKSSEWTRYIIDEVLSAHDEEMFTTTIEQVPNLAGSGIALPHTVQCKPLVQSDVVRAYSHSQRRVFFLDFGGTLVAREQENLTLKKDFLGAMGRGLSDGMRQTLEHLCRDEEHNVVFIISGDTRTVLMRVFADLHTNGCPLGLVAHSGLCIRPPRKEYVRSISGMQPPTPLPLPPVSPTAPEAVLGPKSDILYEKAYLEAVDKRKHELIADMRARRMLAATEAGMGTATTTAGDDVDDEAGDVRLTLSQQELVYGQLLSAKNLSRSYSLGVAPEAGNDDTEGEDDIGGEEEEEDEEDVDDHDDQQQQQHAASSTLAPMVLSPVAPVDPSILMERGNEMLTALPPPLVGLQGQGQGQGQQQQAPTPSSSTQEWTMTVDIAQEWSEWIRSAGILKIIKKYCIATGGTTYRTSAVTTVWDYTFADPEWGSAQAQLLIAELEAALKRENLNIVVKHTKSTVQLLPKSVDKGSAVKRILNTLLPSIRPQWGGQAPDFCLCLGDDTSDEFMFGAVHQYFTAMYRAGGIGLPAAPALTSNMSTSSVASGGSHRSTGSFGGSDAKRSVYTATVGRKPTTATNYVRDVDSVHSLLHALQDAHIA